MEINCNSHEKRSDKETQSSLIRIFKEIIMREKDDSEKRNLLSSQHEQREDRKRKQQNRSRSKIDRRSNGSTSSEHRNSQHKSSLTDQRVIEDNQCCSEKKGSWLNWGSAQKASQTKEDSCSCVSCALRRIVDSEYACIVCLLLVFILSIGAAGFLVFRNSPIVAPKKPTTKLYYNFKSPDSERLKRKIDLLNDNGVKNELSDGVFGKLHYDDLNSNMMDLPVSSDVDFGSKFQELPVLEDGDNKNGDIELSMFLDPEKLDLLGNDKLREFYKKLVQTDANIKSLKKFNSPESIYNIDYDTKSPGRSRRSLKLYHYLKPRYNHFIQRRDLYDKYTTDPVHKSINQKSRSNHFNNKITKPSSLVENKKELFIQFEPVDKKKVPKCSHTPKYHHIHHHEYEQKHPFYQNSQRLDELLDRLFNKNLSEVMSDQFGLDELFQKRKNKCKHPKLNNSKNDNIDWKQVQDKNPKDDKEIVNNNKNIDKAKKIQDDFKFISNDNQIPEPHTESTDVNVIKSTLKHHLADSVNNMVMGSKSTTNYARDFYHNNTEMFEKHKQKIKTTGTNNYKVLLSVSTVMNSKLGKSRKVVTGIPFIERVPRIRHLMQADGGEENLGYEDFKEVLTNDMENQDDVDRRGDRKKRKDEADNVVLEDTVTGTKFNNVEERLSVVPELKAAKFNPSDVHNSNWKGPMPLYPDELYSMIQHKDMNDNKPSQFPTTNTIHKNVVRRRKDISDMEYIEDYLDNRYVKLVEMAQAYSDYGVFEGKKDNTRYEKNQATDNISAGHNIKLSADGNLIKDLLGKMKESSAAAVPLDYSVKGNKYTNLINEQNAAIAKSTQSLPSYHSLEDIKITPTTEARDDNMQISKVMKSHFNIVNDKKIINAANTHPHTVQPMSTYSGTQLTYGPKINKIVTGISKERINHSKTTVSNVFKKVSDWFKTLEGVKLDEKKNGNTWRSEFVKVWLQISNHPKKSKTNNITMTPSSVFPQYDSDMIKNITHRSRVLLSIRDDNVTDEGTSEKEHIEVTEVKNTNVSTDESKTTSENISTSNVVINENCSIITPKNVYTTVSNKSIQPREARKKVKRNADGSNLIFWSDIYDDEYGIQTDNIENVVRDKYDDKKSEFIKKSGRWVQEKFKKIAENLKGLGSDVAVRKRTPREMKNLRLGQYPKYVSQKIRKRDSAFENENYSSQKNIFSSLRANMIEVCKKTANAVKQTRNTEAKEDSNQGSIATSLMQQLVGLLTELVDYQVEQKSCIKLPPDLQSFLEWLTLPEGHEKMRDSDLDLSGVKEPQTYDVDDLMDVAGEKKNIDHNPEYELPFQDNEGSDQKSSYLDTLRSVQDLLEQYELMNEEDKTKMTGAKYYLQNQMKFLTNVLEPNAYGIYDKSNLSLRYKRMIPQRYRRLQKRRRKRKLNKFIRNFGKKHTRTTANFYDGLSVTEMNKIKDRLFGSIKEKHGQDKLEKFKSKDVKRNLKDVYYRAVAEAKKYTNERLKKRGDG